MIRRTVACSAVLAAAGAAHALADVRVIHASPDAPAVDIFVNADPMMDPPAIPGLAFPQITDYIPLPTDIYNFKVTPAGDPSTVVIDVTTPIDGNTFYTIAATDFLSNITPVVYIDDNTLDPDNARVRFIHLSPDAPAVDIFAAGVVDPIFANVSFQESGGYISVPAGTYDLDVRIAGGGASVLSLPGVSLDNNTVYTVFAIGSVAAGTLGVTASVDAIPAPASLALLGLGGLVATRRRR